jgi:hypothetical protein
MKYLNKNRRQSSDATNYALSFAAGLSWAWVTATTPTKIGIHCVGRSSTCTIQSLTKEKQHDNFIISTWATTLNQTISSNSVHIFHSLFKGFINDVLNTLSGSRATIANSSNNISGEKHSLVLLNNNRKGQFIHQTINSCAISSSVAHMFHFNQRKSLWQLSLKVS